jgi:ABC-type cobalamin/Fe3+-siderophores transport system ATPase subunit
MEPVVEVRGLTKRYGGRAVVDGVDLEVAEGEIVGLLGANGAGKTTTVECLQGLRRADGGTVRVLGLDPAVDGPRLRTLIGSQQQESALPDRLRCRCSAARARPRSTACWRRSGWTASAGRRSPRCPAASGSGCSWCWRCSTGRGW